MKIFGLSYPIFNIDDVSDDLSTVVFGIPESCWIKRVQVEAYGDDGDYEVTFVVETDDDDIETTDLPIIHDDLERAGHRWTKTS